MIPPTSDTRSAAPPRCNGTYWSETRPSSRHPFLVVPEEHVEGYDVAIAYDPLVFTRGVLAASSHTFNNRFSTRDLIVAELGLRDGRALKVACTHWPSRSVSGSEALRFAATAWCWRIS